MTKGTFKVYITPNMENNFVQELQLRSSHKNFDFMRFLKQLNESIPLEINRENKVRILRNNREIINQLNIVDKAEKTVLIGDKKVPDGQTPRDKTLRKLYLYTKADPSDIDELIKLLKLFNRTVAWTKEDNEHKVVDIREIIAGLNG